MEIWKILGDNAVKMIDSLVVVTSFRNLKEYSGFKLSPIDSICDIILISLKKLK